MVAYYKYKHSLEISSDILLIIKLKRELQMNCLIHNLDYNPMLAIEINILNGHPCLHI